MLWFGHSSCLVGVRVRMKPRRDDEGAAINTANKSHDGLAKSDANVPVGVGVAGRHAQMSVKWQL